MNKNNSILFFMGILILCSCRKNQGTSPTPTQVPDVYLAGFEYNTTSNFAIATYWKNGVAVHLTDGLYWAEALAVAVSGNDVYVAGFENRPNEPFGTATYWKNGTIVPFVSGDIYGEANSIFISGNDIYIAGTATATAYGNWDGTIAVYWKNGVQVNLTPDSVGSSASSINISGNDIYVAGASFYKSYDRATYWKNGHINLLDTTEISFAAGIAVSGNDVYVTTSHGLNANYLKNGVPVELTFSGSQGIIPTGIAVSGQDVYVSGYSQGNYTTGLYWKNGTPVSLISNPESGSLYSIAISGSDVYTTGLINYPGQLPTSTSKYWKNNNPVMSIDSVNLAYVKSIFLVNK